MTVSQLKRKLSAILLLLLATLAFGVNLWCVLLGRNQSAVIYWLQMGCLCGSTILQTIDLVRWFRSTAYDANDDANN